MAEGFKRSPLRSLRSARRLARKQKVRTCQSLEKKLVAKMRRLINRNGCDLPYFPRVIGDRPVAGELARGGDV